MPLDIPAYSDYLADPLRQSLLDRATPIAGVDGLRVAPELPAAWPQLHAVEPMQLVVDVYCAVRAELASILTQRKTDRQWLDEQTLRAVEQNADTPYLDPHYQTVVGRSNQAGEVLIGPSGKELTLLPIHNPRHIAGPAVTLFGPPDSEKMCINAMNALHRRSADEPRIIEELVEASGLIPRWGADSEDSKTPFVTDLFAATENLARCYDRSIELTDPRGKHYKLAPEKLSVPIKRIPGLALPDGEHFLHHSPLPLHLVDFVLHAWRNRHHPEAQVFYVPKLENEAEAAYLHTLLRTTEEHLHRLCGFTLGTMRVFIVFETPRAIFRIREMAAALHPYLAGGSLGWHDFLAATARLFRHDPNYRIPVKADPNIVIHHIKESHVRLATSLGPIGAVTIGGMYGVLFEDENPTSYQVSMVGYIRDVVTQLRRGLTGFWVAHPDFVRIGVALVEAVRRQQQDPTDGSLWQLCEALIPSQTERHALQSFLNTPDVDGLTDTDPLYSRALLAADIQTSTVIDNSDPEEVRYNIFQALQYLAAWLSGSGCVALPATLHTASGEPVFIRVMDDLATTERSRWELWAEVNHGRVPASLFEQLLQEEIAFIQAAQPTNTKRVQILWEGETGRWYPVAVCILRQLVLDPNPVEAVTELLLPFTFGIIRDASDPWAAACRACPGRYR